LVAQVIDIMKRNISDGTWPVGSQLPLETELQDLYGVSRVTLRQAVQALVHVGLLETVQGSGTFVTASSELDAVLSRYLADSDLVHLLEARLAVEPEAADIAARRVTSAELSRMEQLLAESLRVAEAGDAEKLVPLSADFHRSVVLAAHNPLLTALYEAIEPATETTVRSGSDHAPLTSFVHEHGQILDALKRGDGEAAFAAARSHLGGVLVAQHPTDRESGQ
jgi:DNA-binding FadR family transcriptional regulator